MKRTHRYPIVNRDLERTVAHAKRRRKERAIRTALRGLRSLTPRAAATEAERIAYSLGIFTGVSALALTLFAVEMFR